MTLKLPLGIDTLLWYKSLSASTVKQTAMNIENVSSIALVENFMRLFNPSRP